MRQKIDDTANELISFKYDSNGPSKVIDVVLNGISDSSSLFFVLI